MASSRVTASNATVSRRHVCILDRSSSERREWMPRGPPALAVARSYDCPSASAMPHRSTCSIPSRWAWSSPHKHATCWLSHSSRRCWRWSHNSRWRSSSSLDTSSPHKSAWARSRWLRPAPSQTAVDCACYACVQMSVVGIPGHRCLIMNGGGQEGQLLRLLAGGRRSDDACSCATRVSHQLQLRDDGRRRHCLSHSSAELESFFRPWVVVRDSRKSLSSLRRRDECRFSFFSRNGGNGALCTGAHGYGAQELSRVEAMVTTRDSGRERGGEGGGGGGGGGRGDRGEEREGGKSRGEAEEGGKEGERDYAIHVSTPDADVDCLLLDLVTGSRKITAIAQTLWKRIARPGDIVVDCTCGNGFDTLFLAQLVVPPTFGLASGSHSDSGSGSVSGSGSGSLLSGPDSRSGSGSGSGSPSCSPSSSPTLSPSLLSDSCACPSGSGSQSQISSTKGDSDANAPRASDLPPPDSVDARHVSVVLQSTTSPKQKEKTTLGESYSRNSCSSSVTASSSGQGSSASVTASSSGQGSSWSSYGAENDDKKKKEGNGGIRHSRSSLEGGGGGHVYAFDIQLAAIENTSRLLRRELDGDRLSRVQLIRDCHSRISEYLPPNSVKLITFNLGYLPGSDKSIITTRGTTLTAIEESMKALAPRGVISIIAYVGHDGGMDEYEAICRLGEALPVEDWVFTHTNWGNRPTSPRCLLIYKR
ncbi:hypothetical protein CBR_g32272 [Chara braunii]|uniref:Uncharacterized protein n=1 Tax=Chara braunii TaxID=69332 RepID=A0A388JN69_CHABU|nr:hypothetical protein CBR_g32272 [Chara braunii]|eukprot:GBG59256.1 hypothetical protein CBR_g32272 [Chara braunii]